MMATIENIQYTLNELNSLEIKVKENTASAEEYEKIDKFLNTQGISEISVINKIIEMRFSSYEDYIYQRKINNSATSDVTGTALGIISALKKFISNTL